jgi:hypothetical protein
MSKIVLLPLDERPCNYIYPQLLPTDGIDICFPPKDILGQKKVAGDFVKIKEWLLKETKDADFLILSLDTLLFGGIVPSRINHLTLSEIEQRAEVVTLIKKQNPQIKIFANELIMRCPSYSLSDEEPDYFDLYGEQIFRYGQILDMENQGMMTPELAKEFDSLVNYINPDDLKDFLDRRQTNISILLENLHLVANNIIDFLIIPQDDSNEYGFSSIDQKKIRDHIAKYHIENNIIMYPGADEVGLTLIARAINQIRNVKPKVLVYYSSSKGQFVVPSFEDRIIDETVKYQIYAIGGIRVDSCGECDIVLGINIGSQMLTKNDKRADIVYGKNRNLLTFVDYIDYCKKLNKIVGIADVAYCNNADEELLNLLRNQKMLYKIDAYAGWNTSSNTLGTTLSTLSCFNCTGDEKKKKEFLTYRYYEDYGYMDIVREIINIQILDLDGSTRFFLGNNYDALLKQTSELLEKHMKNYFPEIYNKVDTMTVTFPWNRTFEIMLDLTFKDK